jgi:hypothetical protein
VARFDTAGAIVNAVASEVGLTPATNPFVSTDPAFQQLCNILSSAGRELFAMNEWQVLNKKYTVTTQVGDSGNYTLPADYGYIIDQTGWNPTNRLPLGGPLTPQNWEYLVSTGLATSTIYVSFKLDQGQFQILPQPPPVGQTITFEYVSRWWVAVTAAPTVPAQDTVQLSTDVVLYEPILIQKLLKLRFLEAKGFDTTSAANQFINMFNSFTGKDEAAQTLNMSRMRVFPYLGWRNIPETNYGLP